MRVEKLPNDIIVFLSWNIGDQWNEPGLFSKNGFPIRVLKQILHGSLESKPLIPTSNPNFILDGILLFLKSVIICAARLPIWDGSRSEVISLRLIFIYAGLTFLCAFFYKIFGLGFFVGLTIFLTNEAICGTNQIRSATLIILNNVKNYFYK